jgi:pimeloyl-ACP methyl ester carboxylesterase
MSATIVMLHGAFCGGWAFEGWRAFFGVHGYRCLVPDLRHHDRPPRAQPHPDLGTTSLRDYVDDVAQLIAELDEKPILIGHSMGGLVAQMLAARGLASAVILLAPSPPWGLVPSTDIEVASALGLLGAGAFWREPLQPIFRIAADQTLHLLPRPQQKEVYARFVPESGQAVFEIMYWMMDWRRTTFVDPGRVTCPMLVVAGAKDRVNTARTVRRIAQRYRRVADFEEFRDHAHWLIGEPGWEGLAEMCRNWLVERLGTQARDGRRR